MICYNNGSSVTRDEVVKLKQLEKELKLYDLLVSVQNGFEW